MMKMLMNVSATTKVHTAAAATATTTEDDDEEEAGGETIMEVLFPKTIVSGRRHNETEVSSSENVASSSS